jgi:hypothetical protein
MFKITIIVVGQGLVTRFKFRFYDSHLCILFKFKICSHDIWTNFKDRFNFAFGAYFYYYRLMLRFMVKVQW